MAEVVARCTFASARVAADDRRALRPCSIYTATPTSTTLPWKLRYPVGADAQMIAGVRKATDFEGFESAMRQAMDWHD